MYRSRHSGGPSSGYDVRRTDASDDALLASDVHAWSTAQAISWGHPQYRTRFRALWRDDALAVRFDASDVAPWHTRQQRDHCLWEEEVVEIFLDPTCSGRHYAELEISPANVVCDLHIAQLEPDRDVRLEWDFATLRTVVHGGAGRGDWTAIALLPFADFRSLSPCVAACLPVEDGDWWLFNVFRIKRPHGPADPERDAIYAAWSVPDGHTFHAPEAFRPLRFTGA